MSLQLSTLCAGTRQPGGIVRPGIGTGRHFTIRHDATASPVPAPGT
jgi:hypothetical protein